MREFKDKKGGGLMILHHNNQHIILDKIATKNKDILYVKDTIRGWEIKIVLVYFSVNNRERNHTMKAEVEKILEDNTEESLL